jgi:hypothetical protein
MSISPAFESFPLSFREGKKRDISMFFDGARELSWTPPVNCTNIIKNGNWTLEENELKNCLCVWICGKRAFSLAALPPQVGEILEIVGYKRIFGVKLCQFLRAFSPTN